MQRQQVETLEAAGRHLLAIVNDTLDLARIDAGQVELVFRPFSPAVAAEDCLSLVRAAAVDKCIALRLSIDAAAPAMVSGDSTRLQQILLNVLWNALKFTPDGGRVALWVTMAGGLRFEVSDTGPGISQASWERLFKDFSMLDRSLGGTGLGLAISARLAARMGGRLGYHPGPHGTGSLFRLDLPWHATAPVAAVPGAPAQARPAPEAKLETPPASVGLHLLVVDDVAANRFLLQAMLTADGHRATEAASYAEALTYLGMERFDGVLLDLRMPGIDGLETARRIRALNDRITAATPLIAVSADNAPETLQVCLAAGMVGLVTKPIERPALLEELQGLVLRRARLVPSA
ncbi:MAG: response regulator [Acetobacteraceae bacterium]|nr:response regulator [Acetobacteraceae bacterium]